MKILVVGSGAREHALVLALSRDPAVEALVCAPGNAGTVALARRWPECPPYKGEIPIDELVPHLTIVHTEDRALRQSAANAVSPGLPLRALLQQASLWVRDEQDEWTQRATFPFGPPE